MQNNLNYIMLYVIFGFKFHIQLKNLCEKCSINQQKTTMWKIQSLERTLTLAQLVLFFLFSPIMYIITHLYMVKDF
jgi:hypothetical protein